MEMLEKVERLVEKANVSYEEAKAALDEANGDLLDAMVLLERQGKVKRPEQASFSTQYEEQKNYIDVRDKVEEQEQSAPSFGRSVKKFFRTRNIFHDAYGGRGTPSLHLLGGPFPGHDHCAVLRCAVFF